MANRPSDLHQTDRWGWRPDGADGIEVWAEESPGSGDWRRAPTAIYYDSSIAVQPWVQTDGDFGVSSTVTAHGHVTRTNEYWADVTLTFHSVVDVTTPGTGAPQFLIRRLLGSFDADFSNWYWGWNTPSDLRCAVWGQIAGLPFTGFVNRSGYILDANGDTITRVLVSGDYLRGTVTGVFQND